LSNLTVSFFFIFAAPCQIVPYFSSLYAEELTVNSKPRVLISVVDPAFYLNADPDPDPWSKTITDLDPDPGQTLKSQKFEFLHEK
jgi:hypothetical protein